MSLIDLLPTTKLGYKGGQPPKFDLGPGSTLHYHSSLDGVPSFSVYQDPYLKGLHPTNLRPKNEPVKYLDNLPI